MEIVYLPPEYVLNLLELGRKFQIPSISTPICSLFLFLPTHFIGFTHRVGVILWINNQNIQ
jgi:hypothetical protein